MTDVDHDHYCIQRTRILRLEVEVAKLEADRRQLRADVMDSMSQLEKTLVGMSTTFADHVLEIRRDFEALKSRLASDHYEQVERNERVMGILSDCDGGCDNDDT